MVCWAVTDGFVCRSDERRTRIKRLEHLHLSKGVYPGLDLAAPQNSRQELAEGEEGFLGPHLQTEQIIGGLTFPRLVLGNVIE